MTTYPYFILTNSDESLSKKFRVVLSGYKRFLKKAGTLTDTIDGNYDVSVGSVKERHQYMVRVRETEPETGYGSKNDLETFFRYNSPSTSTIVLTDHNGTEHNVLMWGEFGENLVGVNIEGDTAWWFVDTLFIFL